MFHHIKGILTELHPTAAIVEANGVGYELTISLSTQQKLSVLTGKECLLYAHFAVSENSQALYGFADREERSLFRALISVSGVGPSTAMQILSGGDPAEFSAAVERQDLSALKKIKGIGEKTAKRIILELKGKPAISMLGSKGSDAPAAAKGGKAAAACKALETLGLSPREAAARVEKVLAKDPDTSLEDTIRLALQ